MFEFVKAMLYYTLRNMESWTVVNIFEVELLSYLNPEGLENVQFTVRN